MGELQTLDHNMPWGRQQNETDKAWARFQVYLDLGPTRSYGKVAEITGTSIDNIKYLGRKYDWVYRSEMFDNNMRGVMMPEERDAALAQLQGTILQQSVADYRKMRDAWLQALEQEMEKEEIDVSNVTKLVKTRSTLDIMARRMGRMPLTFSAKEEDPYENIEDKQFVLDMEGAPTEIRTVDDGDD